MVTGSDAAIVTTDHSSFNLVGNSDTVTLGAGSYVALIGGAGNAVSAAGSSMATTPNAGFILLAGGTSVGLAAGDQVLTILAYLAGDVISGLGGGNSIDVSDLSFASAALGFTGNAGGGAVVLTDGVHSAQFQLNGSYDPTGFHLLADGTGGTRLSYG